MTTLMATYKTLNDANMAVNSLIEGGISKDHISIATLENNHVPSNAGNTASVGNVVNDATSGTATGVIEGAKFGGIAGMLMGVAALAIPGLGGLLVAGPLAASLGLTGIAATAVTGAGAGAAVGGIAGFVGSLVKAGVSEGDASMMESTLKEGGVLVSVKEDEENPTVMQNLQIGNPVKIVSVNN